MAFNIDALDSGSNYKFGDKVVRPNFPRSMFDLSHLHTTSIDEMGKLIPIALLPTLPGDSFEISVRSLLRVLPQVVPLYSRQRLYVHAFYSRSGDLWENFNTFMTKGYSGKNIKNIPALSASTVPTDIEFGSLLNMLGLPAGVESSVLSSLSLSALPSMMYLRIWRDYFINKNYYIDDRKILPDNDDDFRLMDDGTIRSFQNPVGTSILFDEFLYRDFPDDYFLSALPFPQRGDTPVLSFPVDGSVQFDFSTPTHAFFNSSPNSPPNPPYRPNTVYDPSSVSGNTGSLAVYEGTDFSIVSRLNAGMASILSDNSSFSGLDISVTLAQIRELAAKQQEMERMARTDGSYAEFGLTFFGRSSKTSMDYRPVYIGGTYQSIAFSEVLQTSQSDTSPLGTYGGHGISFTQNGYIGRCDCDDYGYIMLIASVMPDIYYSQGIDRHWTNSLQSDMFLPTRTKLGMRAILNKELFYSGVPDDDNDLFAYQDPFDEFRYVPSRISGKIANPAELSFFPYTQSRVFNSLPTYSQSFATTKGNIRNDYLAAPSEVPYTAQFAFDIRAVRPLPYKAIPQEIVN